MAENKVRAHVSSRLAMIPTTPDPAGTIVGAPDSMLDDAGKPLRAQFVKEMPQHYQDILTIWHTAYNKVWEQAGTNKGGVYNYAVMAGIQAVIASRSGEASGAGREKADPATVIGLAVEALAGYGTDAFLKVFYEKLGKSYLSPHEAGIRSLFADVAGPAAEIMRRKRDAMAVWDGTHVAQDKRDLPKASPPLTPDGQSTSREGERS